MRSAMLSGNYDPRSIPSGMPSHVTTFAGVMNTLSQTYSQKWDEAIRNGGNTEAAKMLNDPYLGALMRERKRPTSLRDWAVKSRDEENPVHDIICARLNLAIGRIPDFTNMRFSLLEALWFGRAGTTTKWAPRQIATDQWDVPVSWKAVNGDKIAFTFDMTPAIAVNPAFAKEYRHAIFMSDTVPFLKLEDLQHRRQIVIHKHEIQDADYWDSLGAGAIGGQGIRHQIYWTWFLREECLKWAINFMQKVGTMGLLIFWYETNNPAAKAAAEDAALKASEQNVLIFPRPAGQDKETWGVQQIGSNTSGVDALLRLISEYFERHMERLIIGQSLSGNDGGGGLGGAGIAALHRDTKYQVLAFDTKNLDATLTTDLVHPIIRTNISGVEAEDFYFQSILPDPAQADAMNALTRIWDKVPVPEEEVYRIAQIRRPRKGEKTVGPPPQQPAAAAQQGQPAPGVPEPIQADPAQVAAQGQPTGQPNSPQTPAAPGGQPAGKGGFGFLDKLGGSPATMLRNALKGIM
jgi:hypothetical protein